MKFPGPRSALATSRCRFPQGEARTGVPTIQFWNRSFDLEHPDRPQQTIFRGEGSEEMHVRALLDDQQTMITLAVHNSDISDGWEREQENERYFNQYSERP